MLTRVIVEHVYKGDHDYIGQAVAERLINVRTVFGEVKVIAVVPHVLTADRDYPGGSLSVSEADILLEVE